MTLKPTCVPVSSRSLDLTDVLSQCLRRQADAPAGIKAAKDDLAGWETHLRDLQALGPSELTLTRMNTEEIPRAEATVASWAGKRPLAVQKSEEVCAPSLPQRWREGLTMSSRQRRG
jgi:hypothetical protein